MAREKLGAIAREPKPAQGQVEGKAPLVGGDIDLGAGKFASEGSSGDFVLDRGDSGQDDVFDGTVLVNQFLQLAQTFCGGGDGSVYQETASLKTNHRHTHRHDDVENPLNLIEGPNLIFDHFLTQGPAGAIGIEGDGRPKRPAAIALAGKGLARRGFWVGLSRCRQGGGRE